MGLNSGLLPFLLFLAAFALTVLIECTLAALFKSKRLVYAVFLCNLLTNPPLNLLLLIYYNYISQNYYWLAVAILEITVVVIEAFALRALMKYTFKKTLLLSLLFNACSFSAGLILFYFFRF